MIKKIILPFVLSSVFANLQAAPIDDLTVAVLRNSDITVRQLQRQGVNPNALDANGRTPLTYAIQERAQRVLPLLLEWPRININLENAAGESPLMLAIITGQTDLAKTLIQRGAAVNKAGWSPLLYAAARGNVDVMRMLLAREAYVDAAAPNLATPLMYAARFGTPEAVQLLLQHDADIWMRDSLGRTALFWAQAGGNATSIQLLEAAQRKTPDYGKVEAAKPLTDEEIARMKGLPWPPEPEVAPETQGNPETPKTSH